MSFKAGKGAFILLDNVAGTPVDVSAYADNFTFPIPTDTSDTTVFGLNAKQSLVTLTGGGAPGLSGPADVAFGTLVGQVSAAHAAGSNSSTLTWGPGGSVAGQIRQSCEVWVTDYTMSNQVAGRADISAAFLETGAITAGTW